MKGLTFMKKKESAKVVSQECIAADIYSMWIETPDIAKAAVPGQFLTVYTKDADKLLPRPISLCDIDKENGRVRIVYRIAGSGTKEFSSYKEGDSIEIMGPLGNGFCSMGKKPMVIGGGIGIPPMLGLAKSLNGDVTAVLGYRNELFLQEEFCACSNVYTATEDGSSGTKGTVLDAIAANNLDADVIFACGPKPMLRAIKEYAAKKQIPCFISLEERMACGIGACLACVCKTKEVDGHSNVHNTRICKDGPVFAAEEVEL